MDRWMRPDQMRCDCCCWYQAVIRNNDCHQTHLVCSRTPTLLLSPTTLFAALSRKRRMCATVVVLCCWGSLWQKVPYATDQDESARCHSPAAALML